MQVKRLKQLRDELNAHGQMSASAQELFEILDLATSISKNDEADVAILVSVPKEEAKVETVPTPSPAKKATKAKAAPAEE